MKLGQFLVRANLSSYASGRRAMRLDDGCREFSYQESSLRFREGNFEYANTVKGTARSFTGIERIRWKGLEVYKLSYQGGVIE